MNKTLFASALAAASLLRTGARAASPDAGIFHVADKQTVTSFTDRAGRGGLKNLVVEAGTDPSVVQLHFEGARKITFAGVGTLLITKADGSTWRYSPTAYQMVNGKRKDLSLGFHFIGADRVSLRVEKMDPSAPLIIGPVTGKRGNS